MEAIISMLKRFIYFKDERYYFLMALWILHTYCIDKFEYTGYVFLYSPKWRSGKTRFLELLEILAWNATNRIVAPTQAGVFRTATGHTQIFDEVDKWDYKNRLNLTQIFNAGFQRGSVVTRNEPEALGGQLKPREFPVYAARVFAGNGTDILDDTTKDRSFILQMMRQTKTEKRERLNRKGRAELQACKTNIDKWASNNKELADAAYQAGNFPYLDILQDRTIDIAEPIAAVLEVVYAGRPELEKKRIELVNAIAATRDDEEGVTKEPMIFQRLEELASACAPDPLRANATELEKLCEDLPDAPTFLELQTFLVKYGIQQKSHRLPGMSPVKRYIIPYDEIHDLKERYGCSSCFKTEAS